MKITELRSKSKEELQALFAETRGRIEEARFLMRQKKTKNVKQIRGLRKDAARVLTLLHI